MKYEKDISLDKNVNKTRKSSSVNARGIPTAAYQVLPGWGTPPCRGTPLARSIGGVPEVRYPLVRAPPHWGPTPSQVWPGGGFLRWGTPLPGLMGVPKVGYPLSGYPLARSDGGTQGGVPPVRVPPGQVWWGYPPAGPGWGTPLLPGPGQGTPPPGVDRQMDRHESKHNLPVVLRTRSVKRDFNIE